MSDCPPGELFYHRTKWGICVIKEKGVGAFDMKCGYKFLMTKMMVAMSSSTMMHPGIEMTQERVLSCCCGGLGLPCSSKGASFGSYFSLTGALLGSPV